MDEKYCDQANDAHIGTGALYESFEMMIKYLIIESSLPDANNNMFLTSSNTEQITIRCY